MARDILGEVGQQVYPSQCLMRTLIGCQEISRPARDHKTQRNARKEPVPIAPHRHEDIHHKSNYRQDHANALSNSNGPQPIGDRRPFKVMRTHTGIEESNPPKSDQREKVAVERRSGLSLGTIK